MYCSLWSKGIVATVRACSQGTSDSVTAQVEQQTPLEQSPMKRRHPTIPPSNAPITPSRQCTKTEPGTRIGLVDCDAPSASVQRKPIKPSVNRDLPSIKSLKLRLLLDHFVAQACFFYSMAQSLHASGSDNPLSHTLLWAKAIALYREMCGFVIEESTLLVHRDLEKETWGARPAGGLPKHCARLAEHVSGNVVLLRTNTHSIVTSSFGMDTPLTSGTRPVPRREAVVCIYGCGDMEEHCQKATAVVIAEAECDGSGIGGHFRGAVFDHS